MQKGYLTLNMPLDLETVTQFMHFLHQVPPGAIAILYLLCITVYFQFSPTVKSPLGIKELEKNCQKRTEDSSILATRVSACLHICCTQM